MAAISFLVCAASLAQAVPPPAPAPMRLDEALALARASNPTLAAARLRRAVDEAGIAAAGERPNPEARYERARETPHDAIGVSQLLELGGKRGRRIALARAARLTGEAELAETEAEVCSDVRLAFFALAGAQRRLVVARELKDLAGRAHAAAQARYEAGDVSRLDVLQASLDVDRSDNELAGSQGEQQAARADLNALIGRPVSDPTVAAEEIELSSLPDPAAAAEAASASNAALVVLDRRAAEGEARVALARAQRVPDPTLEATLTHGAAPEFDWGYRASVALPLPIFTHHDAAVHAEEASATQVRAERDALAGRVRGAAWAAAARAVAERQQYLRYRDEILPRSRQVEAMAEESYRAGHTNLAGLLLSLQAARELRSQALQSAADYEAAWAALQRATAAEPR